MSRKVDTVSLKSKSGGAMAEYARVPARLKLFREDCPNGLIETTPDIKKDGTVLFTALVLKDKSNPNSAEANGHSMGKMVGEKAFEKLETIAVGRALANLGYLASGEVASFEEMEDFYAYKLEKIDAAVKSLDSAKTMTELKKRFMGLGELMSDKHIIEVKDKRKAELAKPKQGEIIPVNSEGKPIKPAPKKVKTNENS